MAKQRSGGWFDPDVANAFCESGEELMDEVAAADPWRALLEAEPLPVAHIDESDLDRVARCFVGELPIQGVRGHAPAGSEPTPVHRVLREVAPQLAHQGSRDRVVLDRAVHQHQGRSLSVDPHGQIDAVAGADRQSFDLSGGGHLGPPPTTR